MFKKFLVLVALSLPLMAAKCDPSSYAVATCNALDEIYAHYDSLVSSGAVPVSWQNKVAVVRGLTDEGCVNPDKMTTTRLAYLAGRAYITLQGAFSASRGQGDRDWDAEQGLAKLEKLRVQMERMKQ